MPPAPPPYGERREASLLLSFLSWALFIIIIFVVVVSYFTCLGGSTCRVLRVWKALGGSICRILYAARRPADPVKSCPCFILRRFLPRASYFDICFCAPKGRIAPLGASRLRRSLTARLRRDGLIPIKAYRWPCVTLPLHLPGALLPARPKGALRLSARLIGGGC